MFVKLNNYTNVIRQSCMYVYVACSPFSKFAKKMTRELFLLVLSVSSIRCESTNESVHQRKMLEELMTDYNRMVIPLETGQPLNVSVNLFILNFISLDQSMRFSFFFEAFVRVIWTDYRLAYGKALQQKYGINASATSIYFQSDAIDKFWMPDVFFAKAHEVRKHELTKLNTMLLLKPDGEIFLSERMSIAVTCHMSLRYFPFDEQTCRFEIESLAYSSENMNLSWLIRRKDEGPLENLSKVKKKQQELYFDNYEYGKVWNDYGHLGKYDILFIDFHLSRHFQYYIVQMYFPMVLIVVLSWVSFWIDYRSTPARVALAVTAVLTITILGNKMKTTNSSTTAIDVYVFLCFLYVFAVLLEYAFVGMSNLKWKKESSDNSPLAVPNKSQYRSRKSVYNSQSAKLKYFEEQPSKDIKDSSPTSSNSDRSIRSRVFLNPHDNKLQFQRLQETHNNVHCNFPSITTKLVDKHKMKEVHTLDRICRYLFPISFGICNIIYFMVVGTSS